MKVRILTILVVLAVLASSITACTTKGGDLVKVMKLAPEDADLIASVDIEAMATDPDFESISDYFLEQVEWQAVGIDVSNIAVYASIETPRGSILVLIGDFNLEDIRDTLMEEDFVEGEYRGIEIWTDDFEDAIAFISNMFVAGDTDSVEACIRRHKNEGSSMYDDEDMKSVADKLPSGVILMVFGPDYMFDIEIAAGGICLQNQQPDDEVLDITGWFKFDSETSAEAALGDAEDEFEYEFDATRTSSQLRGQFIEITGEMEIPEY